MHIVMQLTQKQACVEEISNFDQRWRRTLLKCICGRRRPPRFVLQQLTKDQIPLMDLPILTSMILQIHADGDSRQPGK